MRIGTVISKCRKLRGLTQDALGEAAQVSTALIAKLEIDEDYNTKPSTLVAIAKALDRVAPLDDDTVTAFSEIGGVQVGPMLPSRKAAAVRQDMEQFMQQHPDVRRDFEINAAIAQFPPVQRGLCIAVLEFADEFGAEAASILVDAFTRVSRTSSSRAPLPDAEPEPILTVMGQVRRRPDGNFEAVDKHYTPAKPVAKPDSSKRSKEA